MNIAAEKIREKTRKDSRTFIVGAVGMADSEYKRLSRIFGVTAFRSRAYKMVKVDMEEKSKLRPDDIDIFVVDTDDPRNIIFWHRYVSASSAAAAKSVIRLSRTERYSDTERCSDTESYSISTPINPVRVLKTLDNYTIRELNYLPEFEIGDESVMQENTLAGIRLLRPNQPAPENQKPINALVCDDSLAVRRQLEIEFNLLNAQPTLVDNGQGAIEAASQNRYDIIFLDVVMPGLDGYATCKKIKKSALNRNTPVVLLTSRSSSFDKLKGTLAGCDSYLTKPINHNDFDHVARQYLTT